MNLMDQIFRWVELLVSVATLATLTWGLAKMFQSAREAKAARIEAIAASHRAEAAAKAAKEHAAGAITEVRAIAEIAQKIELNTNSMKDALVAATEKAAGLAGEERGRQQAAEARKIE